MRLNVDPIQIARQVKEVKQGLLKAAYDGTTDQEQTTGRMGYMVFPDYMITVAGELRRDNMPLLIMGGITEIIGKMAAAAIETLFEETGQQTGLCDLMGAAQVIAMNEIKANKARADAEKQESN